MVYLQARGTIPPGVDSHFQNGGIKDGLRPKSGIEGKVPPESDLLRPDQMKTDRPSLQVLDRRGRRWLGARFHPLSALREAQDVPSRDLDLDLVALVPAHRLRDPLGDRDDEGVADSPEFHIRMNIPFHIC